MIFKAFIGGSYQSQAYTADQERTVNWYPERLEVPGATAQWTLYPTPGVTALSEAVTSPGRAHIVAAGRQLAILGTKLVEIAADGTQTVRGTVALGANPATMAYNGDGGGQVFITSGDNGYIFTLATNVLTQIAALNGIATMGAHVDGYFVLLDSTNSKFYSSNLLDGLTWDTTTDFAQRSAAPDRWVTMRVVNRYIYLLGTETSEVWYNSGASPFPFALHPSGSIPYGVAGDAGGAALFGNAVRGNQDLIWLATSSDGGRFVVKLTGFSAEIISTNPVQTALEGYTTINDAQGDCYSERGHSFFLLHLDKAKQTWCWDSTTRLWHERGTWIAGDNEYIAWRPRWHVQAYGEHRMLDAATGHVYRMSSSLTMDVDGLAIRRLRRAPALMDEDKEIPFSTFELDIEPAVALETGQGSDPQVMMRASNDGGKNWLSEQWRSFGKVGEYSKRVIWDRQGSGRRRVYEVVTSDPVLPRITNAYLTLAPGYGGGGGGQAREEAA